MAVPDDVFNQACDYGTELSIGFSNEFPYIYVGRRSISNSSVQANTRITKEPFAVANGEGFPNTEFPFHVCDDDQMGTGTGSDINFYGVGHSTVTGGDHAAKFDFTANEIWRVTDFGSRWVDVDANHVYYIQKIVSGTDKNNVVKVDKDQNPVWSTDLSVPIGQSGNDVHLTGVAVDLNGNVIVTGLFLDLGQHFHGIWYLDSSGSESWTAHGSAYTLPIVLSDEYSLSAECCCFDSLGNAYVGYGVSWSNPPGGDPPEGDYPWIRKFNSSGTPQWTKVQNFSYSPDTFRNIRQRVCSLEISPNNLGNRLLAFEYFIGNDAFPGRAANILQYSDPNHSTLDFTVSAGSGLPTSDPDTTFNNRGYASYDKKGWIYGGLSTLYRISPSGDTFGTIPLSSNHVKNVVCTPGRHPVFI